MFHAQHQFSVDYQSHTACRGCGSGNLSLLIDYGMMPLAGGFMKPEDVGARNSLYPLRLVRCAECTLMQVMDSVNPEKIFSQYSYKSSTTQTLVDHFARMGKQIVDDFSAQGKLVVEFGCNDGVLMSPLCTSGAIAVGVDPSDVALRASEEQGWPLFQNYFNEKVAEQILGKYGAARIVVGNNVFAHVDDIHAIVRGVTVLLEEDGVFIFEVHYQGDLINSLQFDTVYHEHICYYSLTSLVRLLSQHELKVVDVSRIPIHAGSIRVIAARSTSSRTTSLGVYKMIGEEKELNLERFVDRVQIRRKVLREMIGDLSLAGRHVVAYGAAGRMTILLNYCGLGRNMIDYVVDMSPLRYGKVVPGVLIPIVSPDVFRETIPDYAIMTAWNYEDEILFKEKEFLRLGGRFIIPLPAIRIVDGI